CPGGRPHLLWHPLIGFEVARHDDGPRPDRLTRARELGKRPRIEIPDRCLARWSRRRKSGEMHLVAHPAVHQAGKAAERRRALFTIASNTGCVSVGELPITRSTSAVAVCCSRASVRSRLRASSSLNNRTFSMVMTAWSEKVFSSSISLSEN